MRLDPYNALITAVEPAEAKPGPLSGKRLLVKDLIDTAGIRTTYGSKIYGDHIPDRTAPSVTRLVDAGAVVVGKGNLPEFAWAVMGQNPFYGTVHNPAAPGKTTGGSSSGNAAALAADLCDIALGTDTGCSIRLPSACCETVGLKPRWGSIGMEGVFPLCPTLDTLGPMARTVEEVALAWSLLKDEPVPEPRLDGLTVGLLRQPPEVGDGRATEPSDLADGWTAELQRLGARVVEARIPEPSASTWPVFNHEALQSHRETFPSRADEYSDVCRTKLEAALKTTPDEVEAAFRALGEWRQFEPEVDLYVAPCYTQELPAEDADELQVRLRFSEFLRWVNLIGWAGLAIGNLQLIAPHDETVLAAGLAYVRG
ncbi:MAG TPA: amidase [Gaiellaceae bacterium]|nr:amidase [Gaiellaceae bacterium]